MAIVTGNPLLQGITGMLGRALIFKTIRGKTIISKRPKPSGAETALQRSTRDRFREATRFAKAALVDQERKEYYKKQALEMNLPNAYTAAITDFMRRATGSSLMHNELNTAIPDKLTNASVSIELDRLPSKQGVRCEIDPSWLLDFKDLSVDICVHSVIEEIIDSNNHLKGIHPGDV